MKIEIIEPFAELWQQGEGMEGMTDKEKAIEDLRKAIFFWVKYLKRRSYEDYKRIRSERK